jgi:hypothetical protein
MTCAGIACVSAASHHIKDKGKIDAADEAVKRAEKWLNSNFTVKSNPPLHAGGLWHFCFLFDLERASRLAAWSKIGDHDWHEEGVCQLLKVQDGDGGWKGSSFGENDPVLATSLALLFLRPEASENPQSVGKK